MTVLDFADYRMRMRAGVPSTRRSYYLVGLTHGVRRGTVDPAPRQHLAGAILTGDPHAVVHDPVASWCGSPTPDLAEFHRLTELAAGSEVCVAWLPDRESIADAAAELQAAHRGGSTVVAITDRPDDFIVRAFASVVLPDVAAFTEWLQAA